MPQLALGTDIAFSVLTQRIRSTYTNFLGTDIAYQVDLCQLSLDEVKSRANGDKCPELKVSSCAMSGTDIHRPTRCPVLIYIILHDLRY